MGGRAVAFMGMNFESLDEHYRNPPGIGSLILEAKDSRKRKNDLLVILPSYHDPYRLRRALAHLKKQSYRGFDVAVILAGDDRFVGDSGLPLYQVKRKIDFGFAGSVYLGQLVAHRDRYKYYLFVDIDRIPYGRDSLKKLHDAITSGDYERASGNYLCEGEFYPPNRIRKAKDPKITDARSDNRVLFNIISVSSLKKTGLYLLPIYIGYEDIDYAYRLRSLRQTFIGDVAVTNLEKSAVFGIFDSFSKKRLRDPMNMYATFLGYSMLPVAKRYCAVARPIGADLGMIDTCRLFKSMLSNYYTYELFRKRYPKEMEEFGRRIARHSFGRPEYEFSEPPLSMQGTIPAKGLGNAGKGRFLSVIDSLFLEENAVTHRSLAHEIFAYNRVMFMDPRTPGRAKVYSWRKRLCAADKALCLSRAALSAARAIFNSYYFELSGKPYPTMGYAAKLLD